MRIIYYLVVFVISNLLVIFKIFFWWLFLLILYGSFYNKEVIEGGIVFFWKIFYEVVWIVFLFLVKIYFFLYVF